MSGLTGKDKDEFWKVVEECLIDIHKRTHSNAKQRCEELRRKIELAKIDSLQNPIRDIFYHAEPFDIACDIAQHHLNINNYRNIYDQILDRHKW